MHCNVMAVRLPRIAATAIERNRVNAWLAFHAGEPVRLLAAPAGWGKTTCAVLYARSRANRIAFVSLTPPMDRTRLFAQLARAIDVPAIGSYDYLVDTLSALGPLELIIDNIDAADGDVRNLLAQLYLDVPAAVRFIYIACSENSLPLQTARAQGFAYRCDPNLLSFDGNETARCAEALDIRLAPAAAAQLRSAAGGWPIAVAGACRTAALKRINVLDALTEWRRENTELQAAARPALIEVFGRFEMSIGGRPVAWIRRRDREIVQFLTLQPDGAATRQQLVAAFWPEADRQLAAQSLRTACSTIRRAISVCAGPANVGFYFKGERVVSLARGNTIVSADQFRQACDSAADAYEHLDFVAALGHYRTAQRIYRAPLLAGEPPAAWALPFERRYAEMHAIVTMRLAELGATSGAVRHVHGARQASPAHDAALHAIA